MRVLMTVVGALGLLLLFDGLTTRERRRKSPLLRRLDRLADESGMQSMTGVRLIGASVASGLAVYFVVAALTSSSIESVVISAVAASLPVATARGAPQTPAAPIPGSMAGCHRHSDFGHPRRRVASGELPVACDQRSPGVAAGIRCLHVDLPFLWELPSRANPSRCGDGRSSRRPCRYSSGARS